MKYRAVESFVRNKYEHKKYAKKDGLPPKTVVQETTTSTKNTKQEKVGRKAWLYHSPILTKKMVNIAVHLSTMLCDCNSLNITFRYWRTCSCQSVRLQLYFDLFYYCQHKSTQVKNICPCVHIKTFS
jgi:hypothetical protein